MLRVGVIGLGVGEQHIYGFNQSVHSKTTRICDNDTVKLADVSARSGVKDTTENAADIILDPEIDVVSIASYDEFHAQQVIMALDTGKHVFVEKPICLTLSELDCICDAYERSRRRGEKLKVSSNFILRHEERFLKLKKRIEAGELGEIYLVEGSYDYGRVGKLTNGWRANTQKYSVMHGGGIHILDLFVWLTGQKFEPHSSLTNKVVTSQTKFRPNDLILTIGKFGDNILGKISANFGSQTQHFHQLKIYGTKGTFIHDCDSASYFFGSEPEVVRERDVTPFPATMKGDLLPGFISEIVSGAPSSIDFNHIEQIMRTSLAIEAQALS